ncbi:MAG: hypothetical protein LBL07_09920 [Tannerella sp.]|jgi:hypothetical protein|nr:hypothetical protein [Tannerella sp.]
MKNVWVVLAITASSIPLLMGGCSQSRSGDGGLSPFGVLTHLEGGGENNTMIGHLDLVAKMGARWNRTDFSWSYIEHPQGKWSFETHDRVVDRLLEQQIQPLGILLYDVPWAHPAHKHLDAWLTYVEQTVTHFKGRVRYWEVWNEPNLNQFWENPDGADYALLLKATYAKIKAIDPELTVLYGGTSGIPLAFIEKSFKAGAADCFDGFAFHPYRGEFVSMERVTGYCQEMEGLKRLMEKYGAGDRKLWITEMGLSSWQTVNASTVDAFCEMKRQKEPEKPWKLALFYDDSYPGGNVMTAGEVMALFEDREGFSIDNLGYPDLTAVDVSRYDAVLSPMMENYPALMFDRVLSPSVGYMYFRGRMYFYGASVTEEAQARFLPQAILLSVRFGVERFIWYEFHSSEHNPFEREYFFSLVHHPNLEPKPAYYAYQTLAGVFPEGSRLDTSVEWNRTDFCAVSWIHPDGTHAWAVWTPSGTKQASVKIGRGFLKALDYTGKPLPVTADTQTLELTPGITYLVGPRTLEIK